MAQLLIIYHSRTGGTAQMAEAAFTAAQAEAETELVKAANVQPEQLLKAQGYLFAAPENLAALSGEMKEFFDRYYYPVLGKLEGRPYAQMICAGSDGQNAARQTKRIATGWRLKEIHAPLIICTEAQTAAEILAPKTIAAPDLARCRDLGATLAAGLAMGVF
ncbi:MAG: NAD(P)H-dependent oxidoreductase [Pseudomonadota bacterium]